MSKRAPALYLQDIATSIAKIEEYTKGLTLKRFNQEDKTRDAVVRNIEILGEAASNIPREIREKYRQVPWKRMVGMRNKVVHEYFGVDMEILWQTIKEDLPELKKKMAALSKLSPK